jgi:hypothetical protein
MIPPQGLLLQRPLLLPDLPMALLILTRWRSMTPSLITSVNVMIT